MTAPRPARLRRERGNTVRIRRPACAAGLALLAAAACSPADADGVIIPRQESEFRPRSYAPEDVALAWTTGGEVIVGHTERYGRGDVVNRSCDGTGFYAVPLAGGAARPLAEGGRACMAFDLYAAVSPDGRWAVFPERMPGNTKGLVRLDFATGRMDTLPTGCAVHLEHPAVSPDGRRIAARGTCRKGDRYEEDGQYGVYVIPADSGGLREATPGPVERGPLAWSPDGRRIAAAQAGRVVVLEADGTAERVLSGGSTPAWSPDGAWIAFLDYEPGDREALALFVMREDGAGRRRVFRNEVRTTYSRGWGDTREGGPMPPLVWSPDGRWIAFSRVYGHGTSIWRLEVESGRVEPVTRPDR